MPIGPAGDRVHVPLKIVGGGVYGVGGDKEIVGGDDFTIAYADEKLVHDGRFVVGDPAGDVLVRYSGTTAVPEGTYDDLLDGRLPAGGQSRLSVEFDSVAPAWRALVRRPFVGAGSFDGTAGRLEVTILAVADHDGRNAPGVS